jgi:hypothetical protein
MWSSNSASASTSISEFTRFCSTCASQYWHDNGLHMHLKTCSIRVLRRISMFMWSQPPNTLDQAHQVYQQNVHFSLGASASVRKLSVQNPRVVKFLSVMDWYSSLQVHLGALSTNLCHPRKSVSIWKRSLPVWKPWRHLWEHWEHAWEYQQQAWEYLESL